MIKFIIKLLKFIFALFIAVIIFAYIFSVKNNLPFKTTISYFKTIGNEIFNINNSPDIIINNDANFDNSIEITSCNNYYYEQLDDTAKIIYTSLENNIDNLKKENYVIDFSTTFNDLLNETTGKYKLNKSFQSALDAFFHDHPEIFYIDLTKISLITSSISLGPVKTYSVKMSPKDNKNYLNENFKSEQEVNDTIKKVERIKNSIINKIKDKNTYNKILTVHDMLVNSIEYDTAYNNTNIRNIYGALVEKKVVCEGYAKAFKYIMDSLNIQCILVTGTATSSSGDGEAHMWNYVKLNDNWYGVDVTWDDPVNKNNSSSNILRHNYFLKGANTFITSHNPSGKISDTGMLFSIPSLSSRNYK